MNQPPLVPRPAATLIVAREARRGIEVFLLGRTERAAFVGGAYVFPGGALDAGDDEESLFAHCAGLDDAGASRLLGLDRGGLAFWIAAIRECFEECGLLFAYDQEGELLALNDPAAARRFAAQRQKLIRGEMRFAEVCRDNGLRLAADRLAYFSHWITGQGRPRRFDTRFFVAAAPAAQTPAHDSGETVDQTWIAPAEALERHRRGDLKLVFPTIKSLEVLARFADLASLMAYARAPRVIAPTAPRAASGREGLRFLMPGDYAYAEAVWIDPEGKGIPSYEIVPGAVTQLSAQVRRITAPNPGFMTGPGTNSYLIGAGAEFALVDPGPAIEAHVEALLAAARGRIRWILATHTHLDHSPAAMLLKARTGAELIGMPPPLEGRQDREFRPERVPAHGERIAVGGCMLRAIHTPGHASNHLCYLLENEKLLFSGDHIMQGSTVVINPPDGDMAVYLASLRMLQGEDVAAIAPGHGFLMANLQEVVERLLLHRQERENKVLKALRELGAASVDELLPLVYSDVSERLHPVAARSLLAHLIKLKAESRATEKEGRWRA
ncbi:MAG: MBL fold metallo-hydrolase [Betaproteobacteria bacterium]|nr:MBL fold metallo-hydrolase [Betaproteobacteria bacterium]